MKCHLQTNLNTHIFGTPKNASSQAKLVSLFGNCHGYVQDDFDKQLLTRKIEIAHLPNSSSKLNLGFFHWKKNTTYLHTTNSEVLFLLSALVSQDFYFSSVLQATQSRGWTQRPENQSCDKMWKLNLRFLMNSKFSFKTMTIMLHHKLS